ncbi:MAG: hypothetical protein ACFNO5_00030 [Porphyromonas pasteri]
MMDKIINRYASYLLLLGALLCLSACHRSYEPLPRDERQISPEAGGRLHMNQAEIQSRANAYIRQLAFDLARQELELLSDKVVRDSLQSVLDKAEKFADAHLIYLYDSKHRKRYLNGKKRIAYFLEHGYLSSYEDDPSLVLLTLEDGNYSQSEGMDYVPRDMSELYNLSAYPQTTSLEISAGQLERLDLRGLKDLRRLQIKGAKDGLIVDATDCAKLREIQVTGTPNLTIRQHPEARFKLIVSKSYFSSLSSLGVDQATSLYLENVRLRDVDLLGKVSPRIATLSITVESGDSYGSDGLRYHPLPFDNEFITRLNSQLPQLQRLQVIFAERKDFDRSAFDKLQLPALKELTLGIRPKKGAVARSSWGRNVRFTLAGCPALQKVELLHLYAPEIDLSPLNSSTTPQLQHVLFSGATEALTAPSLSHTFAFDVEVEEVGQINVPPSAKKKGNLTLRDYNSRALVHTSLDHEYLRSQFASVYGLVVSLPPSKYFPHPDEREIWFVFNILDFSGEQWRGFKGLVYFQGLVGTASRTIPIDYLDFGHLTKANINASSITVNPGCVVKNAPEGLRIYYASAGQQE